MADAVTYADLRFTEGISSEKDADYSDVTYENVNLPREKKEPAAPPKERCHPLLAGFRLWAPHLTLLLLLVCLTLSAVTIERTMKYLHVSRELQALITDHRALNESLMRNVRSKELALQSAEQRVEQLMEGAEELNASLQRTKDQLHNQTAMKNKAQMELERAEKTLSEARSQLSQWEIDICPENWILVGRKCLLITDEVESWMQCDQSCKNRDTNLIVVQWNDKKLKDFLSNKTGDCWVGKELRWKQHNRIWEWPNEYRTNRESCWQIRNGNLMEEGCAEKKRCICERNLVLVKLPNYGLRFDLWNTKYNCWREW